MTDPDAVALLRAIVQVPDDDTPRLVYADWLQENGRTEEAEFLRVQCRLDTAEPDDPEYPALLDTDEELRLWLTAHVPGPRPTFPGGLSVEGGSHWWWHSQRGFPRFLHFSGGERPGTKAMRSLASALTKAFDTLPTRWLVLGSVTIAQLATLLKQPVLAGLSALTIQLSATADSSEAIQLLAKCRHLRNLRGLSLPFGINDNACATLASAPWEELEWFAPGSYQIHPVGLRALAGASWFRRLRELTFDGGLTDEAFEELSRLPAFPRLHTLNLASNGFAEAGWLAFGSTRAFPKLTRLELADSYLGGSAMTHLAQATGFKLSVLNAPRSGVNPGTGTVLSEAQWAESLRILNLSMTGLDPSEVKAIVSCKKFTELRHLDLSYNGIGPTGLSALTANSALRELRSLNLASTPAVDGGLTPAHFDRFLSKLDMPELRHLDLSGRPLGPKAARRLAEAKFASLLRLRLNACKLTNTSVAALLASPTLANLIECDLSHNKLTTGLQKLTDRSVLPRLASCTLGGNSIPAALARKLRRRPGVRI